MGRKFLEIVGQMNPATKPSTVTLKQDRVKYWVENGAMCSETVASLIKRQMPNFLEERMAHKTKKVQAARKARKARVAKAGKAAPAKKAAAKTKKAQ